MPCLVPRIALPGLLAACVTVQAQPLPPTVLTRPDPFDTWHALDAGRSASSWSSLPSGEGCRDGERRLSGHALLLLESSQAEHDVQPGLFSLVNTRHRLQLDTSAQWGCVFAQVALQRQVAARGDYWAWDGSALSWRIDEHWRVGAGRIARQWGPGWDGSLILGTAARPFPSVSAEAASGPLHDSRWWWWLGEVDLSAFFGELEDERGDYARPYLMGLRVVVRPWPWLEFGVSRVSLWGGEGRSNSPRTFLRAVLNRDNHCNGTDCSTQPGDQLGGYDLRLNLDGWLPGVGLYGQLIGEDSRPDDIPLPAQNMYLAGADWRGDTAMAFVEWTDTLTEAAGASHLGVAYNHTIYSDGYRYKQRPLAYWGDGDTQVWSVGGLLRNALGGQALAVLRYGQLNQGGVNTTWPDARLSGASLQWRTVLDRVFGLSFAVEHASLSPRGPGAVQRDTQLRIQLEAWFD